MATFDTNRLSLPTQRRFNAAWTLSTANRPVRILPHVLSELTNHRVRLGSIEEEIERLEDLILSNSNEAPRNIVTGWRCDLWWLQEVARPDSPYEAIEISLEQQGRAMELRNLFPRDAFTGVASKEEIVSDPDAIIVSQALVTGEPILITGNMRLVNHYEINQWATANADRLGLKHPNILHDQDHFLCSTYTTPKRRLTLCVIALQSVWNDDGAKPSVQEAEDALSALFQRFEGAKLKDTGDMLDCFWRDCADPEEVIEMAAATIPANMIESELRHPARGHGLVENPAGPTPNP